MEPPTYLIQENDVIETRNYYTVSQLVEFMDVELDTDKEILVNNRPADMQTLVYENFEVEWSVLSYASAPVEPNYVKAPAREEASAFARDTENGSEDQAEAVKASGSEDTTSDSTIGAAASSAAKEETAEDSPSEPVKKSVTVIVNNETLHLEGKGSYVFVDVFDYIDFDLSQANGRAIVTKINGEEAQYTQVLKDGDRIEIYWQSK